MHLEYKIVWFELENKQRKNRQTFFTYINICRRRHLGKTVENHINDSFIISNELKTLWQKEKLLIISTFSNVVCIIDVKNGPYVGKGYIRIGLGLFDSCFFL